MLSWRLHCSLFVLWSSIAHVLHCVCVCARAQVLDLPEEEEEESAGSGVQTSGQKSDKAVVIKTTTRQVCVRARAVRGCFCLYACQRFLASCEMLSTSVSFSSRYLYESCTWLDPLVVYRDTVYTCFSHTLPAFDSSSVQTVFLPIPGLVPADELKPGDLVGVNKDNFLILEKMPTE